MRCSFKEAKAAAAAAAGSAADETPAGPSRIGKRKRSSVLTDFDEDVSSMFVKVERRTNQSGSVGIKRKVEEAQNLVRTIGFLFEKLGDTLEDIGEAIDEGAPASEPQLPA